MNKLLKKYNEIIKMLMENDYKNSYNFLKTTNENIYDDAKKLDDCINARIEKLYLDGNNDKYEMHGYYNYASEQLDTIQNYKISFEEIQNEFSIRTWNLLCRYGVKSIEDIQKLDLYTFSNFKNVSENTLREFKKVISRCFK